MDYPTKCRIVDVDGKEVFPGLIGKTPKESKPFVGQKGLAELINDRVRITLGNGQILWGEECWWEPIEGKE